VGNSRDHIEGIPAILDSLTPIDRRRLQWEVEKAEDASDKGRRRRRTTREQEAAADAGNGIDPRALLGG
jgi:hypothetical protein